MALFDGAVSREGDGDEEVEGEVDEGVGHWWVPAGSGSDTETLFGTTAQTDKEGDAYLQTRRK